MGLIEQLKSEMRAKGASPYVPISPISPDSENKVINLHGQNYYDLKQLAGDDWQTSTPAEQETFAHLVSIRRMRIAGEKPPEYTQASTCKQCGPIWLWAGAPEQVDACIWCFNRVKGVNIPRP